MILNKRKLKISRKTNEDIKSSKKEKKEKQDKIIVRNTTTYFNKYRNCTWLIGIDECGAGCICGDVTVCAYAQKRDAKFIPDVRDSKKIAKPKMVRIAEKLKKNPNTMYVIVSKSAQVIDEINILEARMLAFTEAAKLLIERIESVEGMSDTTNDSKDSGKDTGDEDEDTTDEDTSEDSSDEDDENTSEDSSDEDSGEKKGENNKDKNKKDKIRILIDGNKIPKELSNKDKCKYNVESIIGGDDKIYTIACASIIAKCTRDKMMKNMSKIYPYYDWEHNVGYVKPKHIDGLKKYGASPLHRRSFNPVKSNLHWFDLFKSVSETKQIKVESDNGYANMNRCSPEQGSDSVAGLKLCLTPPLGLEQCLTPPLGLEQCLTPPLGPVNLPGVAVSICSTSTLDKITVSNNYSDIIIKDNKNDKHVSNEDVDNKSETGANDRNILEDVKQSKASNITDIPNDMKLLICDYLLPGETYIILNYLQEHLPPTHKSSLLEKQKLNTYKLLIQRIHDKLNHIVSVYDFINALKLSNAVISGSMLLQLLVDEEWSNSDIDIFIPLDEEKSYLISPIEEYMWDLIDRNRINTSDKNYHNDSITRIKTYRIMNTNVQCIVVKLENHLSDKLERQSLSKLDFVKQWITENFDFQFCINTFDGNNLDILFPDSILTRSSIIQEPSICFISLSYKSNYMHKLHRILKYISRGFNIIGYERPDSITMDKCDYDNMGISVIDKIKNLIKINVV